MKKTLALLWGIDLLIIRGHMHVTHVTFLRVSSLAFLYIESDGIISSHLS
jgi:hypothetical protein